MSERRPPPVPSRSPVPGDDASSEGGASSAPDHASAYIPPRELPKPAGQGPGDGSLVRIAPEADPRRARTQKAMHVLRREDARRHLAGLGVGAAPGLAPASDDEAPRPSRMGWVVGGGIVLIVLAVAAAIVFHTLGAPP